MSRNTLKIIACVSMLIDHIGYILLPDVFELRLIGRIAMPIFAFFIGEGCLYTKDRKKYFMRVFLLGLLCQAVYVAESLIKKSDGWGYMNILLTFSVSIIVCCSFLRTKETDSERKAFAVLQFALVILAVFLLERFCLSSESIIGTEIEFDYGIFGMTLPTFAALTKNKTKKLIFFSLAHIIMAYDFYGFGKLYFCALIPLVLLLFYNSKPGKANLKYFFYAFYPVHLAVLYGISFIQ